MEIKFELVDEGCLMFENDHGRWIIEHPKEGYFETHSKLWDTLVVHPDHPNQIPVKFLGSFETRKQATQHLQTSSGTTPFRVWWVLKMSFTIRSTV